MKIKKIKKDYLLVLSVLLALLLITTFSSFNQLNNLKGVLDYPTTTTDEISGNKQNRLEVHAFLNDHQINKEYEFSTSEDLNYRISQVNSDITTPKDINIREENPPYVIESNEDIENIILRASGEEFIGWSGCDATKENRCQVSVTNHQKRKVEAHYSDPEPRTNSLQLFSVSNNPIGGSLSDEWVNANPDLAYKAAYIDLTGSIPDTIGDLNPELQLNLGGNELSGSIPAEIGDLSSTDYIGLYKNNLSGSIPSEIGDLSPIYFLGYDNDLSGSIPSEIGDMGSQVERLELHDTDLNGTVPYELVDIGDLTPSELRLYNTSIDSTASGLVEDSQWNGFNFNSASFNQSSAMSTLSDASNRGGDYIDFCGNSVTGGTVTYDLEGEMVNVDLEPEVNAALEAGWDVYISINLLQEFYVWSQYRPGGPPPCDGTPQCQTQTRTVTDEDGNEKEEEYCANTSTCGPQTQSGTDTPPIGNVTCARLEGGSAITKPEQMKERGIGVPDNLKHVYYYDSCEWWATPGDVCEPVCEFDPGDCGSPSGCPHTGGYECEWEGEEKYHNAPPTGPYSSEDSISKSCSTVHRTY
ncbi:MAG: hypothetical protein ACQEP3_01025 [Patescibacteria group bacterium]